jgi:hypothetical protein
MAAPPSKEDLDSLFGPEEGAPLDDEMAPEDAEGDEAALDMAIDEAFESDDPVARREAFKNAVRLCGHGY